MNKDSTKCECCYYIKKFLYKKITRVFRPLDINCNYYGKILLIRDYLKYFLSKTFFPQKNIYFVYGYYFIFTVTYYTLYETD